MKNRGQPLDGASLYAWVIARHLDRLAQSKGSDFHHAVLVLGSLTSHISQNDDAFLTEWGHIHHDNPLGDRVGEGIRYSEVGALVAALDRRGILGKRPLPHDDLTEALEGNDDDTPTMLDTDNPEA